MDRINPITPFREERIKPFLDGRKPVSVSLLHGGKRTTNYKLELNDGNTYVVRFLEDEPAHLEQYVMNRVREVVPVPVEHYRGAGFAVYSFVQGHLLDNVPEHIEEAGKVLARISAFTFESPGQIGPHGEITPWPFNGMEGFVEQVIRKESVLGRLGRPVIERIESLVCREHARIEEISRHCNLVHGDFNPSNILVHDGKVSAVLDWEFSHSGTPCMDIGNFLRNTDPRHHSRFRSGLAAGGMRLPTDWKQKAELIDLTSHLDFLTSPLSEEFKRGCVDRIMRTLAKFETKST